MPFITDGKSVYGWTANTSGAMRQIVNSGADGIVTDDVRLLQAFLRENALPQKRLKVYTKLVRYEGKDMKAG